jgi:large subunit ribosomal protein L17
MRHQKKSQKFHRTTEERKRLWIDLSTGLIKSGQVITFSTRAKWFRSRFERLITLCKRSGEDTQLAYRKVRPFLSEEAARKLIEDVVPKMQGRTGGYTQVFKLSNTFSDHDKSVVRLTQNA